jgi:hypothetical protein
MSNRALILTLAAVAAAYTTSLLALQGQPS